MPPGSTRATPASTRRRSPAGAGTVASPTTGRTRRSRGSAASCARPPTARRCRSPIPPTRKAFDWWVGLVRDDHAGLSDPYGGSQTGVPGDPFQSGKAAMGSNGSFAIGQLNAAGTIDYDIVQPFLGDGRQAPHPAEHERLRHRGQEQASRRGLGADPGARRTRVPRIDLGQARSRGAGPAVRGVVGHRHLAPAGQPEGDPRGDGGRRGLPAVHRRARARRTTAPSTCSPR